jgi:NADPH2:quinone reductase
MELLDQMGCDHVINTSKEEFDVYIDEQTKGDGVDVIYDAMGADFIRRGIRILAPGGRIICYGAAQMSDSANVLFQLTKAIQFGIYHPAQFMMNSKSLMGVNMLKIADSKPLIIKRCLENVVRLVEEGIFKPQGGKIFKAEDIADAHKYLEQRKSVGKVACYW